MKMLGKMRRLIGKARNIGKRSFPGERRKEKTILSLVGLLKFVSSAIPKVGHLPWGNWRHYFRYYYQSYIKTTSIHVRRDQRRGARVQTLGNVKLPFSTNCSHQNTRDIPQIETTKFQQSNVSKKSLKTCSKISDILRELARIFGCQYNRFSASLTLVQCENFFRDASLLKTEKSCGGR